MDNPLLEVNLISAQGVKSPFTSSNLRRRLQTYAVAWIESSTKLRTRIDRTGSENPMWNERFLFRVDPSFLSSETSSFTVEIYAVGVLTDTLMGSSRILVSNFGLFIPHHQNQSVSLSVTDSIALSRSQSSLPGFGGVPSFSAVQIRRPSGRFHGVLNIAAMVVDGAELVSSLKGATAVRYRDLVKEMKLLLNYGGTEIDEEVSAGESWSGSTDLSDGSESTASSSSCSAVSSGSMTILKELNGRNEKGVGATTPVDERDGAATVVVLCGLGLPRKIHISPSDENFRAFFTSSDHQKKGQSDHQKKGRSIRTVRN